MGIHDGHREKMRSRFLNAGLDAFADHEVLELLLYYAIPRRDTNPIAHALMERYGSLSAGRARRSCCGWSPSSAAEPGWRTPGRPC